MVKHSMSVVFYISAAAIICLFSSCQTTQPDNHQAMANLSNELEEANQKIEEIYHRVSVVQFMVDNHERTITDLEKALKHAGVIQGTAYTPITPYKSRFNAPRDNMEEKTTKEILTPKAEPNKQTLETSHGGRSAESIYNQGFAALKNKNYTKAVSLFKTLITKYPAHNLADNAIYWTGEIHYTQHDYPEAIRTFKRLIENYPEGGKVPDSLLKIGYSYYSMKDNENAVKYLKKVVVDFPFTVSGSKAETMLNRIE